MVSIDQQIGIEKALVDSPKAHGLYTFLEGQKIIPKDEEASETDRIFYTIVEALKRNDRSAFERTVKSVSERKFTDQSPLLYDNYLIFVLICRFLPC